MGERWVNQSWRLVIDSRDVLKPSRDAHYARYPIVVSKMGFILFVFESTCQLAEQKDICVT